MTELLTSGAFVLSIFGSPVYASEPIPIPVETIEQRIDRVAMSHRIATTSLFNLVMGESGLVPSKVGDMKYLCTSGVNLGKPIRAKGLVQITDCYEPTITDAQAFDPDWALNWAADKIVKGEAWKTWTVANCYSYAKTRIKNLPAMKDIQPNTPYPVVGGLLIEYFNGVKHISVIEKVSLEGQLVSQTNKEPFNFTKELRPWNNKNREGYWRPTD